MATTLLSFYKKHMCIARANILFPSKLPGKSAKLPRQIEHYLKELRESNFPLDKIKEMFSSYSCFLSHTIEKLGFRKTFKKSTYRGFFKFHNKQEFALYG